MSNVNTNPDNSLNNKILNKDFLLIDTLFKDEG